MRDVLTIVGLMMLCVVLGAVITMVVFGKAFVVVDRVMRGKPLEAAAPAAKESADYSRVSPDAAAHQRVMQDAIDRGADQLMAAAKEAGMQISRKQALADARRMLEQAPPGVPG